VAAWSIIFLGVLLPLAVLYCLERTARRLYCLRLQRSAQLQLQLQQQATADGDGGAGGHAAVPPAVQPPPVDDRPPVLPVTGFWLLDMLCASSVAWTLAAALQL